MHGRRSFRLWWIAPACVMALAACRAPQAHGPAGPFPHAPVVLVSIDTLRSDHLPPYGYQQIETPAISAFARQGVLFERAYSHIPLTLPSHASILTGLLPGENGVRDNLGYRLKLGDHPYLPDVLHQAGYATGGAVSAFVLRKETGINHGFDFYAGDIELRINESVGQSQRTCSETLAASRDWLRQAEAEPFFFFIHFYEPHTPYEPPADVRARVRNPYDGEIVAVDRCFGDLENELRKSGVWDRAIVILISDHGEGLSEHGEPEHGILLYREALQVPFIVKLPGEARAGQRDATPVSLVDLFPTITTLLGLPTPEGLAGRSVFALADGDQRPIYSETFYPRLHLGWNELTSIIRGNLHGIFGPDPELYDLAQDPGERDNLRSTERREFASLLDDERKLTRPLNAPMAEDAETIAQMAALGYLGGGSLSADDGPLPDPKTKISSLRDYNDALSAVAQQEFTRAAQIAEKLCRDNPRMVDAWDLLGLSYSRLGELDKSIAAYRKALELNGGTPHIAIAIGTALLELGKLDEAEQHAKLALDASPAPAHTLLASIAVKRKDYAVAEREAKEAIAAGGTKIAPMLVLAGAYREQDRLQEALDLTDQALQLLGQDQPKYSGLYLARGDVLARLGRIDEAMASFKAEIDNFPWDPRAYSRLAALLVAAEHPAEAGEVLRALLARNPDSPAAVAAAIRSMRILGDPQTAQILLARARQRFPGNPILDQL